jgi:hypothetical protein
MSAAAIFAWSGHPTLPSAYLPAMPMDATEKGPALAGPFFVHSGTRGEKCAPR